VTLALLGAYATAVGGAYASAARDPSPERLQRAVGAGILGLMPLQATLLAGAGALAPAAAIAGLWPLARSLARRKAVT
jgi:4-hydroxybenzoate polyprenyltransferase